MAQLTTLAAVRAALGTTTATDAQITNLIASASARIELWLNRTFDFGDWVEWQDGGYSVTARHAPVTRVQRVGFCDGTVFFVQYNGTDPIARVDVANGANGKPGILTVQSIAQPYVVTKQSFPLSGTVQDLVTAISAYSGWSASFNGDPILGKAAWIPSMTGVDATVTQDGSLGPAQIPVAMGELFIGRLDGDSGAIQLVASGTYFNGGLDNVFGLGANAFGGSSAWGNSAFGNNRNHFGQSTGPIPRQFRGVVLDYTGGPNDGSGNAQIPADVAQACIDMVQYLILNGANSSQLLGGESLGGYSYTMAGGASGGKGSGPVGGPAGVLAGLDALMKDRLAGWARMPLAC